jgi:hypothetical protein
VLGFDELGLYRGGGGVAVAVLVELDCLVIERDPVNAVFRSLISLAAAVVLFLASPNIFRFGTSVGAGIANASSFSFSSFFLGVPIFLSVTLDLRTSFPVPRLTLLHTLFGDSFSSSWAGSFVTWFCRLLFETCFSMKEGLRLAMRRLPGEGILRREGAAEAVFTPEGWMIGGVRLGVAGVRGPRGKRVETAV